MRLQEVRAGRQCIRPEVCRTYNFGAIGSSGGQYFNMYLRPIRLNNVSVPWNQMVREWTCHSSELRTGSRHSAAAHNISAASPDANITRPAMPSTLYSTSDRRCSSRIRLTQSNESGLGLQSGLWWG